MAVIGVGRAVFVPVGRRRGRSRIRVPWPVAVAPAIVIVGLALAETVWLIRHASAVHEALGAAASFVARTGLPRSAAARERIRNVVRTGAPEGASRSSAPGWSRPGADIQISTLSYRLAGARQSLVRIVATVPYDPLLAGLMPIPAFDLRLSRDQAVSGD